MKSITADPLSLSRIPSTPSILRHLVLRSKVYIFLRIGNRGLHHSFLNQFFKLSMKLPIIIREYLTGFFKKVLDNLFFFWY